MESLLAKKPDKKPDDKKKDGKKPDDKKKDGKNDGYFKN